MISAVTCSWYRLGTAGKIVDQKKMARTSGERYVRYRTRTMGGYGLFLPGFSTDFQRDLWPG